MKNLTKWLISFIVLSPSLNAMATECLDEKTSINKGNSDFSIERKVMLNSELEVRVTDWFLGYPKNETGTKQSSFNCQPKLLFTELLVKCPEQQKCNSIESLYQEFSDNFYQYRTLIDDIQAVQYQSKDRFCGGLFYCPDGEQPDDNLYLSDIFYRWKSASQFFAKAVEISRSSVNTPPTFVRFIGHNDQELNIQFSLNNDSKQWQIKSILEVVKANPQPYYGGDKRSFDGIKADSMNFIDKNIRTEYEEFNGGHWFLFKNNEYWDTLYDANRGLDCDTEVAEVQTLSANGAIENAVANYFQCRVNYYSFHYF